MPLKPNFFFFAIKKLFCFQSHWWKNYTYTFFPRFSVNLKIRAPLVHRRVWRRLGRIWSVTSAGEPIFAQRTWHKKERRKRSCKVWLIGVLLRIADLEEFSESILLDDILLLFKIISVSEGRIKGIQGQKLEMKPSWSHERLKLPPLTSQVQ